MNMFLNTYVLEILRGYPLDGSHPYYWPKMGRFDGVTMNLEYKGELIAEADELHRTYCCGLTFEVWFRACQLWAKRRRLDKLDINGFTPTELKRIKADWFVATGKHDGPVDALAPRGLGLIVDNIKKAVPGDFIQLWRASGSGHSVIFLDHIRDETGDIFGIKYWSTQTSTNGIGEHSEYTMGRNPIVLNTFGIVRAITPVEYLRREETQHETS